MLVVGLWHELSITEKKIKPKQRDIPGKWQMVLLNSWKYSCQLVKIEFYYVIRILTQQTKTQYFAKIKSSIDHHIFHGSKIEQTLFPRNGVKDNHKTSTTKTYRVKTQIYKNKNKKFTIETKFRHKDIKST